jgi:hypothetical protein
LIKYVIKIKSKVGVMKQDDNKRVNKVTGNAGRELPAPASAEGAMNEGKGQGLVVVGGGLAREAGRRALTALEFQELAAVAHEAEWFGEHR